MLFQVFLTLNSAVFDLTDLLRLIVLPSLAVVLVEEIDDEKRVDEIDECVANVAMIPVVYGEIKEVESSFMI